MISRARYTVINACHILIDGLFDTVAILLTFMVLSFGAAETEVGLVVSAGSAVGTAAGLGTLLFSRHMGFIRGIASITAVYGAGFLAASFSGDMLTAGLCFVFAMAGHNVFHNLSFSYLTTHTEKKRLGRVLSDFTAIGDIGRIPLVSLAAFVGAYTYGAVPGWKAVCLGYGLLALCAAVGLCGVFRDSPSEKREGLEGERRFPAFGLLRERQIFLSMLAGVLNAFSNERIFTFLPLLLVAKGADPALLGTFALGFSVGSFLGKMFCGRFVDLCGAKKVFIYAQLLLSVLLCVLIAAQNLVLIISIALLLGIVTKGTIPVIQAVMVEPVESSVYDDIFSISSFLRGVTNMLTPLLFGFTASACGLNSIYAIMAVVAVAAVVPVIVMQRNAPG